MRPQQLFFLVPLLAAGLPVIAQDAPDKVNVPLTDPSRPAMVHVSLMNGGITVTGYNGKEVMVEARSRGHESSRESHPDRKAEGMRRLDSRATGLSVEEQDNEVNIGVRSMNRTVVCAVSSRKNRTVASVG